MDAEWLAMARRCARLAARRGEPLNGFRCRVHSTYTVQGRVASASARACLSRFTPELGARDGIPFIYFEEARQGPVHRTRFSAREHAPRLGQTSISTFDLVVLLLHERRVQLPLVSGLTMAKHRALAFPILLLPIATFATAWVAAMPHQLQAGSNDLQRGLYGPASAEYFGPYLDEHGSARGKTLERQPSKDSIVVDTVAGIAAAAELSRALKDRSRLARDAGDRLERNLDQIGGGNLLRRGLLERESAYDSGRWPTPMVARNLDQIGGGNLLRDVDDRPDRNLDQIGGGNLVRSLDGVGSAADNLRRNLDQIGGGNLVRGLAEVANEIARERAAESRSRSNSHLPLPLQSRYAGRP